MENLFTPQSLTIKQIFGNADSLYRIPRYQRPYKWDDDQIDKLWDDITEAYDNGDKNYFLGSIILANNSAENSQYWDVVDGQQRITTLIILFRVVSVLYPNINNDQVNEDPSAVDKKVLEDSITLNERFSRIKLVTHPQHCADFEKLIIKGKKKDWERPYKYQVHIDEEPKYKFINTACSFKEKLEAIGVEKAGKLINYLFNSIYIIRINCSTREFAIRMFQVLNDRGLDLTSADLIKSYLMEKLETLHKDKEKHQQKEDAFIADWQRIEQLIKNLDIDINEMLVIYEYYLLEQNPKKSLYDELEDNFKNKDPNEVISDFKEFTESYKKNIYDSEERTIYGFWYIRWNIYWKTILLTALHEEYKDYEKLKIALLRFYYLYWIAGNTLSKIKQTSFNLIKWVKERKPIEDIQKELDNKLESDSVVNHAIDNLNSTNLYNTQWLKPLLLMIEYNQTDSNLPFIELGKDLHIEHVLPEKYYKFKEWTSVVDKEFADTWLNRPGNLTLLCGSKNIEASNNPFDKKIKVYKGKGLYESKDTKITAFHITQKIVNDYNQGIYDNKWNKKAIIDRWNWFCDETEKLLDIPLSKIKNPK
jgi:uncharacterized protein with ParB-like and HNH nuclease domain